MEGGHEARRIIRTSGQVAEFHSVTSVTHVNHSSPSCLKQWIRKVRNTISVNSLAASRCRAPILRRMYPRANPTPEHQTETMARTANNDLSFATNLRIQNAGYVIKHRTVRIAIREKLGVSKPRNSGFNLGNFNLESRNFSANWELVADGGREAEAGSSTSNSPPFEVKRGRSVWTGGVAGFSVGRGLELSSPVQTGPMLRAQRGSLGPSSARPESRYTR